MADISDVEAAFVSLISATIYPNGTSEPSTIVLPSGGSLDCRVAAGWPLSDQIDADVAATPPVINISVYSQAGLERNTSRFPRAWHTLTQTPCSMSATVSGTTVTLGGSPTPGHFLTIHAGGNVASYAATLPDTLDSVAAALATQLGVSAQGAVITLPAIYGGRIVVRGGAPGTSVRELTRSNQRFLVTIWAPNNAARVAAAKVIKPALDRTDFMPLPDGYAAWIKYESSTDVDRTNKQGVSCRDLFYWVEYPTTETMVSYPLTTFSTSVEVDPLLLGADSTAPVINIS